MVQAGAFMALALTGSVLAALSANAIGEGALLLAMATPGLAVLILKLFWIRDGWSRVGWRDLGLTSAGLRFWPLAIVLPPLALLPGFVALWILSAATFSAPGFLSDLGSTAIRSIFLLLAVLAEEIGWRGYLLPRLHWLGKRKAAALAGFIHGIWHLPLILLTPYYHGDVALGYSLPLFLVALTLAGLIYGWIRWQSGSLWPVVMAHAGLNAWWSLFDGWTIAADPALIELVAGESGTVAILTYACIAAALWRRPKAGDSGNVGSGYRARKNRP